MARRSRQPNSLIGRLVALEARSWEQEAQIIRRFGIEVSWAKIADIMISGEGVESSNYVTGSDGWMIDGDGNAEFNNVTIRGDIISGNWDGADPANLATADGTATAGFYLDSSVGSAQFMGDMFVGGNVDIIQDEGFIIVGPVDDRMLLTSETDRYRLVDAGTDTFANTVIEFDQDWSVAGITTNAVIAAYDGQSLGNPYLFVAGPHRGTDIADASHLTLGIREGTFETLAFLTADEITLSPGSSGVSVTGDLYADSISLDAGSAGAPTLTFTVDPDTGIYRKQANYLGFSTAGVEQWFIDLNGNWNFANNILYGVDEVQVADGSVSDPSFTFTNDGDTGMYRRGSNDIGFTIGGVNRFQISSSYMNSVTTASYAIKHAAGTNALPTYSFLGDLGTGMVRGSVNQVILTCAGIPELYISPTQLVVPNVYNDSITGTANVTVSTNGRLRRATSAKKYKKKIKPALGLENITLRPVFFTSKTEDTTHIGFIADDLGEQDKRLGMYHDGEIEDFDTKAILAVLAAKMNRLEDEIAVLKAA